MKGLVSRQAMLTNIRTSKYMPEYASMLIEHMSEGRTFNSFAGALSVSVSTIKEWEERHEEFATARGVGEARSILFFEEKILDKAMGKNRGIDFEALKFKAKNAHSDEYKDKTDVAVQAGMTFLVDTGIPMALEGVNSPTSVIEGETIKNVPAHSKAALAYSERGQFENECEINTRCDENVQGVDVL